MPAGASLVLRSSTSRWKSRKDCRLDLRRFRVEQPPQRSRSARWHAGGHKRNHHMTSLLDKAIAEAKKLPPAEQDALAALILDEIESERKWNELFARSKDVLRKLAREALEEHRRGETEPLDPDTL